MKHVIRFAILILAMLGASVNSVAKPARSEPPPPPAECIASPETLQGEERQKFLRAAFDLGMGSLKESKRRLGVLCLTTAADGGLVEAQFELGQYFFYVEGRVSWPNAAKYIKLAADQDHPPAQKLYGFMLEKGYGVTIDLEQARNYYQLAADQGHAPAFIDLGTLYFLGRGVGVDKEKAFNLFRRSADLNMAAGAYRVGVMLAKGDGVPKNRDEGAKYLLRATDECLFAAQRSLVTEYTGQELKEAAQRVGASSSYEAHSINALLHEVLAIDSRRWVINQYLPNSTCKGRVVSVQGEEKVVQAQYNFNTSLKGWVRARFKGSQLQCVEFWDYEGTCRPLGASPSTAALGNFLGAVTNIEPSPRQRDPDFDAFMAQKQREEAARRAQSPR